MKLFGTNKNSKHKGEAKKGKTREDIIFDEIEVNTSEIDVHEDKSEKAPKTEISENGHKVKKRAKKMRRGEKAAVIFVIVLCVVVLLLAGAYALFVKPPEVSGDLPADKNPEVDQNVEDIGTDKPADDTQEETAPKERNKYTFLLTGRDRISGCTDTMMVATFDATAHTLNVVSIPRDTLVNVEYSNNKKINALYNRGGIEELKASVADILGFEVDFYVAIDLNAFVKLVDAIGGVRYNVPANMHYEDSEQNLYIHVNKGEQLLDGATAVQVVRFRKGYSDQDIGRINTQQGFLMAAAGQMLANVDSIPISTLASIITEDVDTDLTYGNIIWFAKEAIKMDVDDIRFDILPGNYEDAIWLGKGYASYVTIYVDEWLELLNEFINPYDRDITEKDVDILTRDSSGKLYATSGVKRGSETWGMGKKGPSKNNSTGSNTNKNNNTGSGDSTGTNADEGGSSDSGTGGGTADNTGGAVTETPAENAA